MSKVFWPFDLRQATTHVMAEHDMLESGNGDGLIVFYPA
jgi:hypothetical protein